MLIGKNLIAGVPSDSANGRFTAGGALAEFEEAAAAHGDDAREAAEEAAHEYRRLPAEARAAFLDRIADQIEGADGLLDAAHRETALPPERLAAERGRTSSQLRMFANLVRDGSWVNRSEEHTSGLQSP